MTGLRNRFQWNQFHFPAETRTYSL